MSFQSRCLDVSEKEFLFGTRKSLILGMRRFHFLSEASWKTVTFCICSFYFYFFHVIVLFHFLFNSHKLYISTNIDFSEAKRDELGKWKEMKVYLEVEDM